MINLTEDKINEITSSYQVPVKPDILTEIQSLAAEDEPDITQISNLIASDVGLSATILKIINSPFYGMSRRISEIKQAVMMLGINTINALVTSTLLKQSYKGAYCISMERFWDDAQDLANAMTFIGNNIKSELPIDMLYTVGLFEDCGIPLLAGKYDNYKNLLIKANEENTNSIALEEAAYRTNHAILGYFIASSWHLPKGICQIILQHHDVNGLYHAGDHKTQLAFAALKAAENMVEVAKRYKLSADWPTFEAPVLDVLGLSEDDYGNILDEYSEMYSSI